MVNRCRLGGLTTDLDFLDKGMKGKWKQATNMKARFVAIFGENERLNETVNVKDQETGKEETINKNQLYNYIVTELMKPSNCSGCSSDSCDDCEEE